MAIGKELPEGMKIGLESDKLSYFLGENILIYYRIDNTSDKPFKISTGGDYRGSRPTRFKVSAVASDGEPVEDPEPFQSNFGGLMPNPEVKPGESWFEKVYALQYCRFEKPGTYTIHVYHDLGFGEKGAADPREVSITLKLQEPTEEQARAILAADDNAKPDSGNVWGRKGSTRLDYARLRHPAYLPALIERVPGVNFQNALEGMASIRTLEATKALVKLLSEPACARQAASKLEPRLPHPLSDLAGPWSERRKQELVPNAWNAQLAPPVREFALHSLANKNRPDFLLAASLLRCIGTVSEVPALVEALEYAAERTDGEFSADTGYPPPLSACDKLVEAAVRIGAGNEALPRDIQTPGHALLFIAQSEEIERVSPEEYESNYLKLLSHPIAYVRAKALASLSTNTPASLAQLVTQRMTDTNLAVRNFAFQKALGMQESQHRDIALAELKSRDSDQWSRNAASDIALRYGARYECAMAWASHLGEPENDIGNHTFEVLSHLYPIVAGAYRSGSGTRFDGYLAQRLKARWESFLTANKSQIETGHIFVLGDDLPTDLLPAGFEFQSAR